MTNGPYGTRWKDILTNLHAALDAERSGGNQWLAKANEVRIGIHSDVQSFKASGVYLVPVRDAFEAVDTGTYEHTFTIAAVCITRSFKADASNTDNATLDLLEILGGVVDAVKAQRAGGLTNKVLLIPAPGTVVEIERTPTEGGDMLYSATVTIQATVEV